MFIMDKIDEQSVSTGGFNFRHGGVYLTPSRRTAINYAVGNPFGSELLTHCHLLSEALASSEEGTRATWFNEYSELLAILKLQGKPMLVKVNRARTVDFADEIGETPPRRLSRLLQFIADSEAETSREMVRGAALREALQNQDSAKIASLIMRPTRVSLTVEQIIESMGQQVNFEAKIVIEVSQLEFEHIG